MARHTQLMRRSALTVAAALATVLLLSACGAEVPEAFVKAGVAKAVAKEGATAARLAEASAARGAAPRLESAAEAEAEVARTGPARGSAAVDGFATRAAVDAQAMATIRACTRGALETVAQNYVEAYANGDETPDLDGTLDDALSGCLSEAYPNATAAVANVTAAIHSYVGQAAAAYAAQDPTPQQVADWLIQFAYSVPS